MKKLIDENSLFVVSNTTPIISLIKADALFILGELFGTVNIPDTVYRELTFQRGFDNETEKINEAKFISVVDDFDFLCEIRAIMDKYALDRGESSVIAYSMIKKPDIVLMDEHKGRNASLSLDLDVMGTIGVLNVAAKKRIISYADVIKIIEKFKENNIRIKESLYNDLIDKVKIYDLITRQIDGR